MEKITQRKDFDAVMSAGVMANTVHFALHVNTNTAVTSFRIGAVVPKRWAKRAVTRNSIKRQIYNMAQSLPYVDASRWLVTGVSVGGLTSVATVARAPAGLVGGINFSGGMGGDPATMPERPCNPNVIGNAWRKMASSAQVPMLWLYWENDKFWGRDVPRDRVQERRCRLLVGGGVIPLVLD